MLKQLFFVGLGGACGSMLRYLTTVLTARYYAGAFPIATFTVNLVGCFLIGLFVGLISKQFSFSPDLRLLLITGFCGGYTTFSAFAFENISLFQYNYYFTAFTYILLSVVLGILAVWLGLKLSALL